MVRLSSKAVPVPSRFACRVALLLFPALATFAERREVPHGRLEVLNGCTVVTVDGTPREMGTAYGRLLGPVIQRVVRAVVRDAVVDGEDAARNIAAGSRTMAEHQPKELLEEIRAMAAAAEVDYDDLLLLQYFGDVRRCIQGPGSSSLCTSFALIPPLTGNEVCLIGRNFDYFDGGVGEYASILAHYRPQGRIPFVTVTWAGVVNGWTLLNARGIVISNNTAFGARSQSLEGMSTCNLMRYVAERAATLQEGIDLIRKGPRSCGTSMLVACGKPPDAAVVEFDHEQMVVRRPERGFVGAANSFFTLYQEPSDYDPHWGRIGTARDLALKGNHSFASNIAGAEGVPIASMNLHSAMVDATHLRIKVAMGRIPAFRRPYRAFRLSPDGLVADPEANQDPLVRDPPPSWNPPDSDR